MLDKTTILSKLRPPQLKTSTLNLPELGGSILVRELTGSERDQLDALNMERKNIGDFLTKRTIHLVSCGVIDEKGNSVFNVKEVEELHSTNAPTLQKIEKRISELSGITKADQEQTEKN